MARMKPDPIDVHVGRRLRARRIVLGLSQSDLAGEIGVSFQQVQKLEQGANRISAARLYRFARKLGVAPGYFFEELERSRRDGEEGDVLASDETLRLIEAYDTIESEETRRLFKKLMKSVSAG